MKGFLLTAVVAALVVARTAAAAPSAHSFRATVVARTAGGALVAHRNGAVTFVRARARVGDRVVVSGAHLRVVGRARSARVRGVFVARRPGRLVLSAAHRLLVVRTRGRQLASVSPSGPQPGDVVGATVSIGAQGEVTATATTDQGQLHAGQVQVQATVAAVDATSITLDVNGQSLVLSLPAGTTVPTTAVGTQATLTLAFAGGQTTASEDGNGEDGASGQPSGSDQSGASGQSGASDQSGASGQSGSSSDGSTSGGDQGSTGAGDHGSTSSSGSSGSSDGGQGGQDD